MSYGKPRIVRCKLCRFYKEGRACWFCSLHHHVATDHDGCTWGAEEPENGEEDVSNGTCGTKS